MRKALARAPLRLILAAFLAVLVSCGGSPTAPAPPPPPPPPPPAPTNTWSVAGRVLDTVTNQPVAGARIAPTWDLAEVIADGDGAYSLGAIANPPATPFRVDVSGSGYITRSLWILWQRGPRSDVTLDVIRDAAPFSMNFYRQLVRGAYDQENGPYPVLRWMETPRFYVKTVEQDGRPVEPDVLAVVLEALGRAVPAFTGGRMPAIVETGTSARPETDGWINVDIVRDRDQERICGRAFVGRNPGLITLYNDACSCGSNKIPGALVLHEVGHALGFFHVSDPNSVMYPFIPSRCPAGRLSPEESYHSNIAYLRPRGNVEPDNDPHSSPFIELPAPLVTR